MSQQISSVEVKKHSSESSAWMVIHSDVYDVTKFLEEHPGGADSLLEYAGKDGSQAFEDVGHSDDAREIMKKYKIGTLPPNESPPPPTYSKLKWVAISVASLLVIGFAARKYINNTSLKN